MCEATSEGGSGADKNERTSSILLDVTCCVHLRGGARHMIDAMNACGGSSAHEHRACCRDT